MKNRRHRLSQRWVFNKQWPGTRYEQVLLRERSVDQQQQWQDLELVGNAERQAPPQTRRTRVSAVPQALQRFPLPVQPKDP